jgi:hypothetical protein
MSLDGLIATLSIVGSVNTDVFLFYIQKILAPQMWAGAILVMDNLSVHYASVVQEAIEAVGAKVVFLPISFSYRCDRKLRLSYLFDCLLIISGNFLKGINKMKRIRTIFFL